MKKNYKLFQTLSFIITITSLFFTSPARSDTTYVSGPIVSANWTLAGSPYVVMGDILVAGLIIDPGVSVLFAGNYEFQVQGIFEAIGTEQSQIIFTTKTGVPNWKGIKFQNSNSGSFMKYCIVEKANSSGVRIFQSFPNLINCIIRNNTNISPGGGMAISNTIPGVLVLTNCNFEQNQVNINSGSFTAGGGGIYLSAGTVELINCQILQNRVTLSTSGTIDTYAAGGGISTYGILNLKNCLISRNRVFSSNSGCCQTAYSIGCGLYSNGGVTTIKNSIIAYDSATSESNRGGGVYTTGNNQTIIENSTVVYNQDQGLWRESPSSIRIINSIIYFNNNNGTQISGTVNVTFSDVHGGYSGIGNIDFAPILDACLRISVGSPCVDAGNDSVKYRDVCFPPSLGNPRNDMGAHGGPGACNWLYFQDTTICTPWPVLSIKIELTALMQGLYNPVTNMMSRPQSEILYLRKATCPFSIVEPAAATLGQNGISTTEFTFNSVPSGTYYLVTKNWNCLETWSKPGGELLYNDDGGTYYYDFTTASTEAYGNNLIQIDDSPLKYGIYSGDVSQFGAIDLADVLQIYGAAGVFSTGYNVNDLNGDNQVNLNDLLIVYNNSAAFVEVEKPVCAVMNP